jgi:hypothetical protein
MTMQPIEQRVNNYILIFPVSQSVRKRSPLVYLLKIKTQIAVSICTFVYSFVENLSISFLNDWDNARFSCISFILKINRYC